MSIPAPGAGFGIVSAYVFHGENMKLAIPVWNSRVSPVFDTATQILVVDIDDGQVRDPQGVVDRHYGQRYPRQFFAPR